MNKKIDVTSDVKAEIQKLKIDLDLRTECETIAHILEIYKRGEK